MAHFITRILVPTDGSDGAAKAARWAAQLGLAVDATVVLFYVAPLGGPALLGLQAMTDEDFERYRHRLAEEATKRTREGLPEGVRVESAQAFGDPAKEIVHYATKFGVDIIVMGNRGLTPFKELMLGSVSDKVMRHASVPVTIVH